MKKSTAIGIGIATVLSVGAIVGTVVVLKKLKDDHYFENKKRAEEATQYLTDKYGEEVMEGKRLEIVDADRQISKADIAQDILKYNVQ